MDVRVNRVDTFGMTILVIFLLLVVLAVASYFFGVDSRVGPERRPGSTDPLRVGLPDRY